MSGNPASAELRVILKMSKAKEGVQGDIWEQLGSVLPETILTVLRAQWDCWKTSIIELVPPQPAARLVLVSGGSRLIRLRKE
jgi:hypothetical protein